jgi:hypothetical protein
MMLSQARPRVSFGASYDATHIQRKVAQHSPVKGTTQSRVEMADGTQLLIDAGRATGQLPSYKTSASVLQTTQPLLTMQFPPSTQESSDRQEASSTMLYLAQSHPNDTVASFSPTPTSDGVPTQARKDPETALSDMELGLSANLGPFEETHGGGLSFLAALHPHLRHYDV